MNLTENASRIGGSQSTQRLIALLGNPNVGKSTVFNALTNMRQHTGNWPGKTVAVAQGIYEHHGKEYLLVDLPGCYSLMAHSPEEEIARNFICFDEPDVTVIVCDATCLERNLNLVLQSLEIAKRSVVCVNLLDEAKKKRIEIDLVQLEKLLGVPVVGCSAKSGEGLLELQEAVEAALCGNNSEPRRIKYPDCIEHAIETIQTSLKRTIPEIKPVRWAALRLLEGERAVTEELQAHWNITHQQYEVILDIVNDCRRELEKEGVNPTKLKDQIVASIYCEAEIISKQTVTVHDPGQINRQLRMDRLLTGKYTGIPIMLLLLCLVFYITVTGANYPSELLSKALFWLESKISRMFVLLHAPQWLHGALVLGVYRVLAWVISVMLPPMAIFFPLFTILEDLGYLPRVAFVLDDRFKRCGACGKQALTTCMGFGCNAAGVIGCRIIDSPRERLIAILTNNFVPCNGRFPLLISLITIFFVGSEGAIGSILAALQLMMLIVLAICMTFAASSILSKTVLKGIPSSFTLELPPYRCPQITKVIVRSVFDRTIFVLGRAAAIAAPAGLLIWILSNVTIHGTNLLNHFAIFLNPFANLLGMDGVILTAFIFGFPANEIVLPIALMIYTANGSLSQIGQLSAVQSVLLQNGWNWVTALCTLVFTLFHWPCSTTLLTIYKETASIKWTVISALLPTMIGMGMCFVISSFARILGLI